MSLAVANRRFSNSRATKIRERVVHCPPMENFLFGASRLFSALNREFEIERRIAGQLWRLRAALRSALLPFDSPALAVSAAWSEILLECRRQPSLSTVAEAIDVSIAELLEIPSNPKTAELRNILNEVAEDSDVGLLLSLAPGMRIDSSHVLDALAADRSNLSRLSSTAEIKAWVGDVIVVPGSCTLLVDSTYAEIFQAGRSSRVEVLLYPGERAGLRAMASLPGAEPAFAGNAGSPTGADASLQSPTAPTSDEMVEFWDLASSGTRKAGGDLHAANFVLLADGRGVFLPAGRFVTTLTGEPVDELTEMVAVPVSELAEGDCIVLRKKGAGLSSEGTEAEKMFDQSLDAACDWRPALEALLLTMEPTDIAARMRSRGAVNLSLEASIRHWADGTTYGPGSPRELAALLAVLGECGKIDFNRTSAEDYAAERWERLKNLRSGQQRLGRVSRRDAMDDLRAAAKSQSFDQHAMTFTASAGPVYSVVRVAALDGRTRWVHPNRMMQLVNP